MSSTQPSRGIRLPGIGQALVIVAVGCAAWLLWSEFHDRGWIPGVPRSTSNLGNRLRAVDALVQRGREGIPELVEAFSDADPKIRRLAITGLGRIGPQAVEALGLVRGALADEDVEVRRNAISAFWTISHDAETAAPIVARMMADVDGDVRESAARTLEIIGPEAVGLAIELLQSDSAPIRSRALRVLWKLRPSGPEEKIDAAVNSLLNDPDSGIHIDALFLVISLGQGSLANIAELMRTDCTCYVSPNPTRQSPADSVGTALSAVGRLGPDAAQLLPEIVALLDRIDDLETSRTLHAGVPGQDRQIQVFDLHPRLPSILHALGSMKLAAQPAVPTLLRRLEELHASHRIAVIATLIEIGADENQVIPVLTPLLTQADPDDGTVWQGWDFGGQHIAHRAAVLLVRAFPDEARRQVSLLIPQLAGDETATKKAVLYALWGLAPVAGEAVPALGGLVSNPDREVAWHAIKTLGEIGADAAPAVPALIAKLSAGTRNGDGIYEQIVSALGCIGPPARTALPVLTNVIERPGAFAESTALGRFSPATQLQLMALSSVGKIGETTPELLAAVHAQLQSENYEVRVAALKTLALLAGDSPECLAVLVRLLDDEHPTVRGHAALSIGRLKSDRDEAVAALVKNLADENPYVRAAAAVALGRIGPAAKAGLPALRELREQPENLLPLREHTLGRKWNMPSFERIAELNELTIDEAARTAIAEIEAGPQ